jgi:hypothetical protein
MDKKNLEIKKGKTATEAITSIILPIAHLLLYRQSNKREIEGLIGFK